MNSTFHARWLASSEVISQVLFTAEQPKRSKMAFVGILSEIKLLFGRLIFRLLVYTKTIIHLSVGECGGYLPCRFAARWIFNNYSPKWRWPALDIYRAAKRRGKYPTLATDTEVNSCFSIYYNSEIIYTTKINLDDFFTCHGCKLGRHFSRVAQR